MKQCFTKNCESSVRGRRLTSFLAWRKTNRQAERLSKEWQYSNTLFEVLYNHLPGKISHRGYIHASTPLLRDDRQPSFNLHRSGGRIPHFILYEFSPKMSTTFVQFEPLLLEYGLLCNFSATSSGNSLKDCFFLALSLAYYTSVFPVTYS